MVHFRPVSDCKSSSRKAEDIRYDDEVDVYEEQLEVARMEDSGRGQNLARFRTICQYVGKGEWVKGVEPCSFP